MFKQAQIVAVTIAALTPLLVAVALAASIPSANTAHRVMDVEQTWSADRYASVPHKTGHKF